MASWGNSRKKVCATSRYEVFCHLATEAEFWDEMRMLLLWASNDIAVKKFLLSDRLFTTTAFAFHPRIQLLLSKVQVGAKFRRPGKHSFWIDRTPPRPRSWMRWSTLEVGGIRKRSRWRERRRRTGRTATTWMLTTVSSRCSSRWPQRPTDTDWVSACQVYIEPKQQNRVKQQGNIGQSRKWSVEFFRGVRRKWHDSSRYKIHPNTTRMSWISLGSQLPNYDFKTDFGLPIMLCHLIF